MEVFEVIWAPQAVEDLKSIYDYIDQQSPAGADVVFDTLLNLGDSLCQLPERFPLEPVLSNHPGKFRFIPKWSYKIIFQVDHGQKQVIIARIFSTKQNPGKLKI